MDKTLAAKILAGMALCIPAALQPVRAALPVIDSSNLSQNSVSALENVAHTLKQIQQYRTQLQQYQNMLQNTAAPPSLARMAMCRSATAVPAMSTRPR